MPTDTSIPRRRTRSREVALQFLYQLDLCGDDVHATLDEFLGEGDRPADVRAFARELIEGTVRGRERIDALLARVARNWDLHRMAAVDRNVLRLAVHELLDRPDIPPKVTINEAIELAKKFSTGNSGAFVNGILDRVRIDFERAGGAEPIVDTDAGAGPDGDGPAGDDGAAGRADAATAHDEEREG